MAQAVIILVLSAPAIWAVFKMVSKYQQKLDDERLTYSLTFPSDLSEEAVLAWLHSISSTLSNGLKRLRGVNTIVFEVWGTARGINHRLKVPRQEADYVISQLRAHIPGINVAPDDSRPEPDWTRVIEVGLEHPERALRPPKSDHAVVSILANFQAVRDGEVLMMQWIVAPAVPDRMPIAGETKTDSPSLWSFITGNNHAKQDEIEARRKKQAEPNMLVLGRVASVAGHPERAKHLIGRVMKALGSMRTGDNGFVYSDGWLKSDTLIEKTNLATTPFMFKGQLSLTELVAVMGWTIGRPFVAGLPTGSPRHLFAPEDMPREGGLLIGYSNYPGSERPLAITWNKTVEHLYVGGGTGTGKSTYLSNLASQIMRTGRGLIVIDAADSVSDETLYQRVLGVIPDERVQDVIVLNIARDDASPVGFNPLDQGNPRVAVDKIVALFEHLYTDTSGVWVKELLHHGLYTLAESGRYTIADLPVLIAPRNDVETAWAKSVMDSVKDSEIATFWRRWNAYRPEERRRNSEPILNRFWQITARPEVMGVVGQTTSSFQWSDVLANNKIVLVNLVGLGEATKTVIGTIITDALWTAATSMRPELENYLFLDEFQHVVDLPVGLDSMLREARKHKLGIVMATQFLGNLSPDMTMAVTASARSKVIFATSPREARIWHGEFGKQLMKEEDFLRFDSYSGVAQVSTDLGIRGPMTLVAPRPPRNTGNARTTLAYSSQSYGRPIEQVRAEQVSRRRIESNPQNIKDRPPIGRKRSAF